MTTDCGWLTANNGKTMAVSGRQPAVKIKRLGVPSPSLSKKEEKRLLWV